MNELLITTHEQAHNRLFQTATSLAEAATSSMLTQQQQLGQRQWKRPQQAHSEMQRRPPLHHRSAPSSTSSSPAPDADLRFVSMSILDNGCTPAMPPSSGIVVHGLPEDMGEREFRNMFMFAQGVQACVLKPVQCSTSLEPCVIESTAVDSSVSDSSLTPTIIGLVKFDAPASAAAALRMLDGKSMDAERRYALKVEFAKESGDSVKSASELVHDVCHELKESGNVPAIVTAPTNAGVSMNSGPSIPPPTLAPCHSYAAPASSSLRLLPQYRHPPPRSHYFGNFDNNNGSATASVPTDGSHMQTSTTGIVADVLKQQQQAPPVVIDFAAELSARFSGMRTAASNWSPGESTVGSEDKTVTEPAATTTDGKSESSGSATAYVGTIGERRNSSTNNVLLRRETSNSSTGSATGNALLIEEPFGGSPLLRPSPLFAIAGPSNGGSTTSTPAIGMSGMGTAIHSGASSGTATPSLAASQHWSGQQQTGFESALYHDLETHFQSVQSSQPGSTSGSLCGSANASSINLPALANSVGDPAALHQAIPGVAPSSKPPPVHFAVTHNASMNTTMTTLQHPQLYQQLHLNMPPKPVLSDQNNPPCNTLYVGNLPIQASEDELRTLFVQCPGYKRLSFRQKTNGPMCFVEFENSDYAAAAMNDLYGTMLSNSVKGMSRRVMW